MRSRAVVLFLSTLLLASIGHAQQATLPPLLPAPTEDTPDLPANTRQWEYLTLLSTLATTTPAQEDTEADLADGTRAQGIGAGSAATGLTYSGLAPTQNTVTLDGLSMEQNFSARTRGFSVRGSVQGGPVSGAAFGQGGIRSFRIMPSSYAAEFGSASSAVLAIDSRAATAAWHGEAFAILRTAAMNAANPYSIVTRYNNGAITNYLAKPADTTTQLGGHISLPLARKHRSSSPTLFASWEELLRNAPAISSPETASFYALTRSQIDILSNRGVLASQSNAALNYLDSLTGPIARFSTRALAFARIDQQPAKRDHLVATYTHNRFRLPAGSGFRSSSDAVINRGIASVGDSHVNVDAIAAHWAHTVTANTRNTLRAQLVRDFDFDTPRTPLAQEPAIAPGGYAPAVEIEPDGFAFGTPPTLGKLAYPDEHRIEATDTFELLLHNNLITFGADWNRIDDRIVSATNTNGTFLYDSKFSGLVDWITDYTFNVAAYPNAACPTISAAIHYFCFRSFTQNFAAQTDTRFITHTLAAFVQDSVHFRHSLTLTAGARYEYVLLPLPQHPNTALDEALRTLTTPVHGFTSTFPEDRNNLAARIALSWSPRKTKSLTARLGYGWFYGKLPGTTVQTALEDTALTTAALSTRIRPTTEVSCPQGGAVPLQGFGYPCAFVTTPPGVVQQTSRAVVLAGNFRLPAVQRADLTLDRTFGKHLNLRASYSMALATQLPSSVDINIAPSTSTQTFTLITDGVHRGLRNNETFVLPVYTQRRLTQYGPITAITSHANATYHSGTLESELRDWHHLSLRAAYTFSKAIDYAPLQSGTPKVDAQLDPFTNGYDKGLSALDFPHRFSGDLVYRTNFTRAHVLSNWRLATIATASSGAPYTYEISGGTYLNGGHETVNGSGGATYLPTIGRNTLRLAPRGNVDVRIDRTWSLHHAKLSPFIEAFNLLNARNLTSVQTRAFLPSPIFNATSESCPILPVNALVFQSAAALACEGLNTLAFGQPTSSTSGTTRERQAEIGLRLEF